MAMDAQDIERLMKARFPDAEVTIRDFAGDGDHYAARVVAKEFAGRPVCSNIRWSTTPCRARWAARCMRWP